MPYADAELRADFPDLGRYAKTSPATRAYNCHAWAGDLNDVWWEPVAAPLDLPWRKVRWPKCAGVPDFSLASYRAAHGTLGFVVCNDGSLEVGVEKIAHYVRHGLVSHTARQLPWGTWTSKLGEWHDIEHESPQALEGPTYGTVAGFMSRAIQAKMVPSKALDPGPAHPAGGKHLPTSHTP